MKNFASAISAPLQLLGAQYFKMNSTKPSPLISRRQRIWVTEIITGGQLQVRVEGDEWKTLQEGNGVIYPPDTRYQEKVLSGCTTCHSLGVFFEVGSLHNSEPWNRFWEPSLFIDDTQKLLLPLAEECFEHAGLSIVDDVQAEAAFLRIIAHLLRAERRENILIVASEYPGGDVVAKAHQYMRKRLGGPVQLRAIAADVGMSVSGFAHHYKRHTGNSPMTMLRHMRVEAAKSYLLRERFTLDQIARETGFADAFHLSRTFKEITGVSPRQFRCKE